MSQIVKLLSIPFIAFLSIPFFVTAALTTSVALTTLLLRVVVVYFELVLTLLHIAISPFIPVGSPRSSKVVLPLQTSKYASPVLQKSASSLYHPRRRSSSIHLPLLSAGTPQTTANATALGTPTIPIPHDYESLGGWRLPTDSESESETTKRWTGMNSRLELPAFSTPSPSITITRQIRSVALGSGGQRHSWTVPGVSLAGSPEGGRLRKSASGSPEGYFAPGILGSGNVVGGGRASIVESPGGIGRRKSEGGWSRGQSRRGSVGMVRVADAG